MSLSRRRLLVGGTLSAAATALAPAVTFADRFRIPATFPLNADDWHSVREQFDLDPQYVHLGLFYLTAHPRPVRNAVERFRQRLDRNPFLTVERGMFEPDQPHFYADVTAALARYTGGDPNDFALTSN